MQLEQWIEEKGCTIAWVAKRIGVNIRRMYRILEGFRPSLEEVMAIEEMTCRKVKMEDFLQKEQLEFAKPRKK